MKRISIDPITRLEGHGKIDIFLDDAGRRGQRLPANPGTPRLRAVLRGPAGRGHAEPDGPDLRRLPRGPSPGGHQGPRRRVPRRSAAGGQEAPRVVLQHLLRHRPHDALLRPGRAGFRRRSHRPAGPAKHSGRRGQGGHGRGQARAENAARRPRTDQDDGRPPRASQLGPARRGQPRHQRRTTQGDRGPRTRGRRVRQVLAQDLRRHRPGEQRVRQTHHRRHLRPQDLQHGHGRRPEPHELLRRQDSRHQPQRQGTRQVRLLAVPRVRRRAGRAVVLPEVPLSQEDRLEGFCRRRGLGRLQGHAAVALQRGRRDGYSGGPGRVQADVRHSGRQADQPHAGHALGPAGRTALRGRALGRIGHGSADHGEGIPRAAHADADRRASAASRPRAARSPTTIRPTSAAF